MLNCKICNKLCKSYSSLCCHIKKAHNMKSEQYYIKYLKKYNEGVCKNKNCNNTVSYISLKYGYKGRKCSNKNEYCSVKCSSNDINVINLAK